MDDVLVYTQNVAEQLRASPTVSPRTHICGTQYVWSRSRQNHLPESEDHFSFHAQLHPDLSASSYEDKLHLLRWGEQYAAFITSLSGYYLNIEDGCVRKGVGTISYYCLCGSLCILEADQMPLLQPRHTETNAELMRC